MEGKGNLLAVLYEDDELLAVNKPAGLVCHPTKGDETSSLIGRLRLYLGANARPHLIHRLDRETSGVLLAAKTPAAASELGKCWQDGFARKEYQAIVHGHPAADHGLIDVPLGRDVASDIAIKDCARPDGHPAQTEYWVEHRLVHARGNFSRVRAVPRTGRKHQLRIHFAHAGHAIVGDKLYGTVPGAYLDFVFRRLSPAQKEALILEHQALHSARLEFAWRGRFWQFAADPEPWFTNFLTAK